MRIDWRLVSVCLLLLLSSGLVLGIVALHGWGGRIETLLMVFGDRVWVTLDGGRPRVFLLMVIPGVLIWAAISLHARRRRP